MSDTPEVLAKARDAAERVITVCDTLAELTEIGLDAFVDDTRTQWAVEMGLIRIGEGINRIPEPVLGRYDGQPWRLIVDMRDLAAHQYDDLDPRRVWRTVTQDVPPLRTYLADTLLPGLVNVDTHIARIGSGVGGFDLHLERDRTPTEPIEFP